MSDRKMNEVRRAPVEGEDFYYEGPYLVFTAKFLRDRGYCCENGCRHCPYGFVLDRRADVPSTDGSGGEP